MTASADISRHAELGLPDWAAINGARSGRHAPHTSHALESAQNARDAAQPQTPADSWSDSAAEHHHACLKTAQRERRVTCRVGSHQLPSLEESPLSAGLGLQGVKNLTACLKSAMKPVHLSELSGSFFVRLRSVPVYYVVTHLLPPHLSVSAATAPPPPPPPDRHFSISRPRSQDNASQSTDRSGSTEARMHVLLTSSQGCTPTVMCDTAPTLRD